MIMYAGKIIEEGSSEMLCSALHPYTNALINAIPNKDKRGKNLDSIPGKVPSIEDNFFGCPFAPRCQKAKSICHEVFPPAKEIHTDAQRYFRKVHCYFPDNGDVINE
jgi:oligopeptide/dipeptide ABC transporter ATP-binding protein